MEQGSWKDVIEFSPPPIFEFIALWNECEWKFDFVYIFLVLYVHNRVGQPISSFVVFNFYDSLNIGDRKIWNFSNSKTLAAETLIDSLLANNLVESLNKFLVHI